MPLSRRVFKQVGVNGNFNIGVLAQGGHILAASLGAFTPAATLLLQPTDKSYSAFSWMLPIQAGVPVPIVQRPGLPLDAPLPWTGNFIRLRLALAIFAGSGAAEYNLNADVSVSINGQSATPAPPAPMTFPGGLLTTPDVSRSTVLELIFER